MNRACTLLVTAVVAAGAGSTAMAQYEAPLDPNAFAARRHMDILADRLWKDANSVCWEMYRHYGHNPGFRETYGEMYRAMKDAQHIHDLVHEGAHHGRHDVDHIAADLYEIDKLFHHIEDDVRTWNSGYSSHDSFHGDGYHDYGHDHYGHSVHGGDYSNSLDRKMRYMEQTLHHLMADYGVKSRIGDDEGSAPPPPGNVGPPAPGGRLE